MSIVITILLLIITFMLAEIGSKLEAFIDRIYSVLPKEQVNSKDAY